MTSYLFLIPVGLALVYFLGRLYGRTAHDRTYFGSFYELFILLTAFYVAPLGHAPLLLTIGLFVGAFVLIFLLRWITGDRYLLPTGHLLQKKYPALYYFGIAVESLTFLVVTPALLPLTLYHILQVAIPLVVVLTERIALCRIHGAAETCI